MSDYAIKIDGLGKQYRIGARQGPRKTLRETLVEAASAPFRRARAVLRGEAAGARGESFWALQDVSFEVGRGEVVGIIGRNGAGKSTLLKILSRITEPTCGEVRMRGRVGALLEVGTGFHPELTGRDNIYLNGAILGMRRAEIRRKFDDIVAFAEVEKFIDTPVKHYSSGMYMRLAFAVAAHLEPEILVIDEVLAVGDVAFQKKCLGKIGEIARNARTVLFVSHNLGAIRSLCARTILLSHGTVVRVARTEETLAEYAESINSTQSLAHDSLRNRLERTTGDVQFTNAVAEDQHGNRKWTFAMGETVRLLLSYRAVNPVPSLGVYMALSSSLTNEVITTLKGLVSSISVAAGQDGKIVIELPEIALRPGHYSLYICLTDDVFNRFFDVIDANVSLPMLSITSDGGDRHMQEGYFSLPARVLQRS